MKEFIKNEKGITIVALVVTIVVILVLAGISINLVVGKNGIITKAGEAKKQAIKAEEKSAVDMAVTYLAMSDTLDNTNMLNATELKKEVEKNYGKGQNSVEVKGEKVLIVTFMKTGNKYLVNADGIVIEIGNVEFDLIYYVKEKENVSEIVLIPMSRNRYKWNSRDNMPRWNNKKCCNRRRNNICSNRKRNI